MDVDVKGTRLWFDVDGSALVPDGPEMCERPTVVLLHGGPGVQERTVVNAELNAPGLEVMRGFDVLDQLARIDCPTLVCVGELDLITPIAAAREIADALSDGVGRLEVVEGAGHFTWKDAPERYWPIVTDFLTAATGR
jgi:pimeloyl-ACP methyl ester carboxylesterase